MKITYSLLLFPVIGFFLLICESISEIINTIMFYIGMSLIVIPIVILLYQISKYKEEEDEKEQYQEGT